MKSSKKSLPENPERAQQTQAPFFAIITNPYAGKNMRSAQRSRQLARLIGRHGCVRESRNLDQLQSILSELAAHQAPYIVCDGGDGTIHWVLNTYLDILGNIPDEELEKKLPVIVPTNGGTIDFLARKVKASGGTFGIVRKLHELADHGTLPAPVVLRSFIAEGNYTAEHLGKRYRKLAFSGAIAGFAQKFFNKYYENPRPSLATVVEVITKTLVSATLRRSGLAGFLPQDVVGYASDIFDPVRLELVIDGKPVALREFNVLNVGSTAIEIKYLIRLFNPADQTGKLHLHAGYLELQEVIANLPNLITGNRYTGKRLIETTCSSLQIKALANEELNPCFDGELFTGIETMQIRLGPHVRFLGIRGD
ncbi:MAG: diacylglycerol kinase family protein [Turneriella sp.]|nr:diacylglycerol kinase family protein [Turneriella sp.]